MNYSSEYDIIVVGAGPGGSMAAKTAAENGSKVLLIERKKEIGAPVRCGEGIGLESLKGIDIEIPEKSYSFQIGGAKLVSPDIQNDIVVKTDQTKGYVLDRKVFDKDLAIQAGRAGAEIMVKSQVIELLKNENKIIGIKVETDDGIKEINSKIVIAMDGAESTIARMAGLNTTSDLYNSDTGYEYEMVNVSCDDLIEIYFSKEYAPRGYLWIFPKSKDVANVGVGVGGKEAPYAKEYLDKWINGPMKERFKNAQPVAIKGGLIPVGASREQLVADGFMVAGTAAHQVDPIHGGGIALAMKAGVLAGKIAAQAIKDNDYSKERLMEFQTKWNETEEKKLKKRLKLRKALEMLNDEDLNVVISSLDDEDIEKLLEGNFPPVVTKVLSKRPQLLKAIGGLIK
ncbi:NAD(P)/FAD-dependent oxidoreductase [Candidatus Micrarchaeota archaeon]|jgi:digeranylgeranylglycerophospholipid reductase|nr:NAD(P)/FAD-dependent oxidoreductase [Candidatus Micrarchaeota archaeon]